MTIEEQLEELKQQLREVRNSVKHRIDAVHTKIIDLERTMNARYNPDDSSAE